MGSSLPAGLSRYNMFATLVCTGWQSCARKIQKVKTGETRRCCAAARAARAPSTHPTVQQYMYNCKIQRSMKDDEARS